MFMWKAIRLADANGRLRVDNARLRCSLAKAHATVRKRTDERDAARRDATLLVTMARDRRVAVEFVQTWHDIDRLTEVEDG